MRSGPSNEKPVVEAGVAFIVFGDDGRILLHKREEEDGWSPPSGTLHGGEAIGATLAREIQEETDLQVERKELVAIHSDPAHQVMRTPDGQLTHFITLVFRCVRAGGELHGSDEAAAWKWFETDRLPRLTDFGREYLRDALGPRDGIVVR